MTLAPVFRSGKLFGILEHEGIISRFDDAMERMYAGVRAVELDLPGVLDEDFIELRKMPARLKDDPAQSAEFLRAYFFLILFSSVFENMGVDRRRLPFYAELSYCIMGTIAAADNLFDREAKVMLPLKPVKGSTFGSILQLMCFERLSMRAGRRAVEAGLVTASAWDAAQKGLISSMATIGKLEGGEEAGFDRIMEPDEMVRRVHMVRGGMLFGLVTVAPLAIEEPALAGPLAEVNEALIKLGTAFQLVDDITDFEFDLTRRSHNIMVAQIHHRGTDEEKALLANLLNGQSVDPERFKDGFLQSGRKVMELAETLTQESLSALERNGFWFPSALAPIVVQGIVADHGAARMEEIAASGG